MKLNNPKHWEDRARPDGFLFQQQKETKMAQKPMAKDYTDLKKYIADKKAYAIQMGKNPNKVALHYYKEQGIYSIDDLIQHNIDNPWAKGLDL